MKKVKKIINLTPHAVVLQDQSGRTLTIAPSGVVARAKVNEEQIGSIECEGLEIPVLRNSYGEAENLPPREEGTIYLVSSLAAQAAKDRDDLYVPARPIRDGQGRIIACQALASLAES